MTNKKVLHRVAVTSTEFATEAFWDGRGSSPGIRFGYEKEGVIYQSSIVFRRMLAMRKREERCCTAWHIEHVYDHLVEIEDSQWVRELRADTSQQWRDEWETHHFMSNLDSAGCVEG